MNDHLAAPLREVLDLYAEHYSDVRFPDLDLDILRSAADDVAAAAAEVAAAEASIAPLRERAKAVEAELTQKVVRALSFLKVYVEGDEEQYARLDALTVALLASRRAARKIADPASAPTAERPRRGRKPKSAAAPAQADGAEAAVSTEEIADADLPSSALTALDPAAVSEPAAALDPAAE
jgi:hypothetical protein